MKRILGIGNALVDALLEIKDEAIFEQFQLQKGGMEMIELEKKIAIHEAVGGKFDKMASGGAVANTIVGLAKLGAPVGYIGKIGRDAMGAHYKNEMESMGIHTHFQYSDIDTGVASTFITEDSERTFATYLGAAATMQKEELDENIFKNYDILVLEGYLIFNLDLIFEACKIAKANGLMIAMDMASYNLVEMFHEQLKTLLSEYVDIIFANEEEVAAFTKKEGDEALKEMATYCKYVVYKLGNKGSLLYYNGEVQPIEPAPAEVVDTTGAGDSFASGILYGFINDMSLEKSGNLASNIAAKCVQNVGARLTDEQWEAIHNYKEY